MTKTTLAIGAGLEQLETIKIAKELGFNVVAIDENPKAEAFPYSDISLCFDITDQERVIQIAKSHDIDFILPTPIGKLLTVVGAVNDALGLKGIGYDAALSCTNKAICNKILRDTNIPVAKQYRVKNNDEAIKVLNSIELPAIIKPNQGSGSRDVKIISTSIENVQIDDGDWLIESFLHGQEYGVDAILFDNNFEAILIRDKLITSPPYRQELRYTVPTQADKSLQKSILNTVEAAAKALNFENCQIQADVIVNNKKEVYIVEIAARPSGNLISSHMIPYACNRQYIKEILQLLADRKKLKSFEVFRPVVLNFIDCAAGIVKSFKNIHNVEPMHYLLDYSCNLTVGKRLDNISSTKDILSRGWVITTGKTVDNAIEVAHTTIKQLEIKVSI